MKAHLCFRFSLWKLGFMSWLDEIVWWFETWLVWKGIRGFFWDKTETSGEVWLLVTATLGDPTFPLIFLGASSLSNIMDVFISACLLLGDRNGQFVFGLGVVKTGEGDFMRTSVTTICSHSLVMAAVALSSSSLIWISWRFSSSMGGFIMHGNVCAIGTPGSETTELTSHVASSKCECSELPQTTKLKRLVTDFQGG